jgi:hypothetical protein
LGVARLDAVPPTDLPPWVSVGRLRGGSSGACASSVGRRRGRDSPPIFFGSPRHTTREIDGTAARKQGAGATAVSVASAVEARSFARRFAGRRVGSSCVRRPGTGERRSRRRVEAVRGTAREASKARRLLVRSATESRRCVTAGATPIDARVVTYATPDLVPARAGDRWNPSRRSLEAPPRSLAALAEKPGASRRGLGAAADDPEFLRRHGCHRRPA